MRPTESLLGQPIRSLQTMLRVIAEDLPEYIPIVPDGIYGPNTIAAVSRFQRNHGLPVTGITNQETWDAVVAAYELSLVEQAEAEGLWITMNPGQKHTRGEHHPNIYLAQSILITISGSSNSVGRPSLNGTLDDATEDSIFSFQQLAGIPATGQLDKTTWRNLVLQYSQAAKLYSKNP